MKLLVVITAALVLLLTAVAAVVSLRSADHRRVVATLTRVQAGSPGSASVTLTWDSFANNQYGHSSDQQRVDSVGNREPVIAYEAQYAVSGTGRWVTLSNRITGTRSPSKRSHVHAKQRVLTRADDGQTIASGFFRLTLSYAGVSALDVHQRSVTPAIPFDASEAAMKAALESLDTVTTVQVFRTSSVVTTGAFEWTVLFDALADSRSDLPLLVLYTETIAAPWSGPGDQVAVQSEREAAIDHVVCASECSYDIDGLPSGQALAFRVRAHYARLGWSEWSHASEAVAVPSTCTLLELSAPVWVHGGSDVRRLTLASV